MIQLSDTQAVILSAACAREDGNLLPVTASLKGGAVNMVLNSLIKKELAEETPAELGTPIWREDEDGTPLTLRATAAAFAVLGIESDVAPTGADGAPEKEPAADMAEEPETPPTAALARRTRAGTKQEALIAMLRRPEGASIAEIMAATGWQAHSCRGAIAGGLKKKLGLAVASEKVTGRGRIYRLASAN
jgi:hypothetical protein